jgi:YbbR domain-containing protein
MAASLLLAILTWFLVTVRERIEVGYLVPLVFERVPANLYLDGSPLGSVYVRLQGSRQTVENILPQQLQARVDLSGAGPGSNPVQILPQMVTLPRGVTLVGISPSYLDLRLLSQAAVPVHVRILGEPAEGYAVGAAHAVPAEVAVVGLPEHVESVRRVDTSPVRVDGRRDGFRERAQFVLPSNHVRLLELRPTEVVVEIVPKNPPRARDRAAETRRPRTQER